MQITVVELSEFLQLGLVQHGDMAAVEFEDAIFAQLLDDPIGMDRRDAHGFADLLLGQRHLDALALFAADDLQSFPQLHHDMRQPARRWMVDHGYQKVLKTSKSTYPATADHLKALHDFSEELKEGLGGVSLYNEGLGTVSESYVYDRVRDRDLPEAQRPKRPWQRAAAGKKPA